MQLERGYPREAKVLKKRVSNKTNQTWDKFSAELTAELNKLKYKISKEIKLNLLLLSVKH